VFETIYSQVGAAATILVVAFAFLKGDESERIGAAAFVLASMAIMLIPEGAGLGPRWSRIGVDIVLLAVFVGLAWHTRRAWPVWATAFQALIVTGHALVVLNLRPPGDAFAAVNNMANYGLLVTLAVGTFWAWQERRAAAMGAGGR
jgi:hypothetical protein